MLLRKATEDYSKALISKVCWTIWVLHTKDLQLTKIDLLGLTKKNWIPVKNGLGWLYRRAGKPLSVRWRPCVFQKWKRCRLQSCSCLWWIKSLQSAVTARKIFDGEKAIQDGVCSRLFEEDCSWRIVRKENMSQRYSMLRKAVARLKTRNAVHPATIAINLNTLLEIASQFRREGLTKIWNEWERHNV